MNVIVPVDGMSATDPFADLASAFMFVNCAITVDEDDADQSRHDQVLKQVLILAVLRY